MTSDSIEPKMTRKERETERNRCEILDVAVKLFAEHGFHETTMQMVAETAEFSVGYLYKHFSGKDEMYRAMVDFHMKEIDRLLAGIKEQDLSPLAELRVIYEIFCEHFNQHRHFMRIYHQRIEDSVSTMHERKNEHFEETVDIFERALAAGELKPQDPRILALALHGASQELFHEMAERDTARPFDGLTALVFKLIIDPQRPTSQDIVK